MSDIFQEVEIIIRFDEQSFCYHKRSHLERRIYAHGTNHNHPEYHERQNDEEDGVIDIFGLHERKS